MLRIIAGKYRHLIIEAPNVNSTRPTTDKVREALMSAIGMYLYDAKVLDLFAGSGALGIESLSRGASECVFSDNNKVAYNTIKKNIEKIRISEKTTVLFGSYKATLEKLKEECFDIVYLDPPYAMKSSYKEVLDYLFENNMIKKNSIVVRECDIAMEEDERFTYHKAYKYGIVHVLVERL